MNLHESDLIRHAKADGFAEGELRGKEIGLAEGAQKKAIEAARVLKQSGVAVEIIEKSTGLSKAEISALQ